MRKDIEELLECMERSSESAALSVADHIRTVAANGREYRTPAAVQAEAEALVQWAMKLDTTLLAAVAQGRAALVGDSNDAEHDALVALIKALGEDQAPECECECYETRNTGVRHSLDCPAKA